MKNHTSLQTTATLKIESLLLTENINSLKLYIEELVLNNDEKVLQMINMILGKPSNIKKLMDLIVQNETLFNEVLNKSYCHENGFHKYVLLEGQNFKIRLHHFGVTEKVAMENIHDHRWPFASTILKGNLEMEMYEESQLHAEGDLLLHYRYNSDKSKGAYETILLGLIKMKRKSQIKYFEGDSYLLTPEALHRITNKEECVTLIITGKPCSTECNLYAKREITCDEKETKKYKKDTLIKNLQKISSEINNKKEII